MRTRVTAVLALALIASRSDAFAQNVDAGRKAVREPLRPLPRRLTATAARWGRRSRSACRRSTIRQLTKLIHEGIPAKGMPPSVDHRSGSRRSHRVPAHDSSGAPTTIPIVRGRFTLTDGRDARRPGPRRGLRRPAAADRRQARAPAAPRRRALPRRDVGGRLADLQRRARRQPLHDADADRQEQRRAGWRRSGCSRCPDAGTLQVTPVVVDGIMYVTAPNECSRSTPAAAGGSGTSSGRAPRASPGGSANRGVAVAGDRVFMVTDHAHLIALEPLHGRAAVGHRAGRLAQELRGLVGAAAGRQPGDLRRVAAASTAPTASSPRYDQATGKEVWRFWTVPKPGEPGSETWQGKDIEHGGAPTWFTGSYDPALDTRLLADRQSEQGVQRRRSPGRQPLRRAASSRSIARPARCKWHYQFTPHDLWDWDATQTSVLVDADWQGQPRQADAARRAATASSTCSIARRQAAAVEAVRQEPDVGQRHRRRRPPDQAARTRSRRPRAPRSARRRTARPTGSRRRSTRRPASTTCRPSRSAASTRRAEQGAVGERQVVSRRLAAHRRRIPKPQRDPAGHRHPHRRDRAGSCRSRARRTRGAAR